MNHSSIEARDGAAPAASRYAWDNAWAQARRRLELLEACCDPGTIDRLERVGVGTGWHCLEVAAGAGSIARWLARRVGRTGRVVATELDPAVLEETQAEHAADTLGVEILRHDVRREALPGGFDLVHARALLMHLPEREPVLDALAGAVTPSGWLLVEEADFFPFAIGPPDYARAWQLLGAALARATGFAADWARDLPARLAARGLVDVAAVAETVLFPGGSPAAAWVTLTWDQVLDRLPLAPPERAEVLHAREELSRPERWFPLPALVAAWGRRP